MKKTSFNVCSGCVVQHGQYSVQFGRFMRKRGKVCWHKFVDVTVTHPKHGVQTCRLTEGDGVLFHAGNDRRMELREVFELHDGTFRQNRFTVVVFGSGELNYLYNT